LRPLPGSEAAGLSEREREVLTLMLEGKENSDIAMELHISPHTARSHVSRVLAAYGTTTRSTLAARVAASMQDTNTAARAGVALGELTPRQSAVVEHVLTGASNADIASGLGISVRTVEKHVNDAMHRWRVGSRVALILRGAGIEVDACPEK
jgi:DNA-binding NarL/FixJ family response regulator